MSVVWKKSFSAWMLTTSLLCPAQSTFHGNHAWVLARATAMDLKLSSEQAQVSLPLLMAHFTNQQRLLEECQEKTGRHSWKVVQEVFLAKAARLDRSAEKRLRHVLNQEQLTHLRDLLKHQRQSLAAFLVPTH